MPAFPPDPSDADSTPSEDRFERFGPLLLERLVKDDGRALIRFSRAGLVDATSDATPDDGAER